MNDSTVPQAVGDSAGVPQMLGPSSIGNAVFGQSLLGGSEEPTYSGVLSFMRRRLTRHLTGADVAVWGVPFDGGVSNRPGARFGPQSVRRASAMITGDPLYPFGIDPLESLAVIDYGDCLLDYGHAADAARQIEAQAREPIEAGVVLISIGGDHFVTWPLLRAHAAVHGPLALVQFDAHQDTWFKTEERVDHGSFVARAADAGIVVPERSIQIGIRTHAPDTRGLEIVSSAEVAALGIDEVVARIEARVGEAKAYITFDIDGLDPAFAPGTGAPVPGGLTSREALAIVSQLGGLNIVGGDVVEVAPAYDHADITSLAAATVLQHYLALLTDKRRDRPSARSSRATP